VTERGLILLEPEGVYTPEILRFFALFWDRLDLPHAGQTYEYWNSPQAVASPSSAEMQYLRAEGILQTSFIPTEVWGDEDRKYANSAILQEKYPTFESFALHIIQNHLQNRALWSIARTNPIAKGTNKETDSRAIVLTLHQALPIPTVDVALADVLRFKRMRQDELLSLRYHLEETYLGIIESPDIPLKARLEVEKLQLALRDVVKCINELGSPFRWGGFEAKLALDVQAAAIGGAIGALIGSTMNLPLLTAFGAVLGGLKVQLGAGMKLQQRQKTPFEYLISMSRDLHGPGT
jgi:hypothetical protein